MGAENDSPHSLRRGLELFLKRNNKTAKALAEYLDATLGKDYSRSVDEMSGESLIADAVRDFLHDYKPPPSQASALNDLLMGYDQRQAPTTPAFGPAPIFTIASEGYEISARPPELAERDDPTQKTLHNALLRRVERLQDRMMGLRNEHPSLVAEFSDYSSFVKKDLEQLDVPALWSAGNGICEFVRAFNVTQTGVMSEPLEPALLADLNALVLDHTAFVMGFTAAQALMDRVRALRDAGLPPREIASTTSAVLSGMLRPPRLLAHAARQLVQSLTRALDELGFEALPLVVGGYETGKNGLIAMGRALHPILILAGAADVALVLAGKSHADTLRATLVYLRNNANAITAFALSDPQMANWLVKSLPIPTPFSRPILTPHRARSGAYPRHA